MSAPTDPRIAPSILAADFGRLAEQVQTVLRAGATVIHVDVMDGHFVPPITMGPPVVAALRDLVHEAGALLDVHLMVERPERQIDAFAAAGADIITFHYEATPHAHRVLQLVREGGCAAGVALCPGTPAEAVGELGQDADLVLCMTVNPGWGGQPFIEPMLDKVARLRAMLPADVALEVDGGVDAGSAARCRGAGANLLVAGSAVFGAPDPGAALRELAAAVL